MENEEVVSSESVEPTEPVVESTPEPVAEPVSTIDQHIAKDGWFVGSQIVENFTENVELGIVGILYEDQREETISLAQWEAIRSKAPYPNTEVSERKYKAVIEEVLTLVVRGAEKEQLFELLVEQGVNLNELDYILQRAAAKVDKPLRDLQRYVQDLLDLGIADSFGVDHPSQVALATLSDILKEKAESKATA